MPVGAQPGRDTRWLVRNWERARLDAERLPEGCTLVIDEIQKIPQWSETVKGLWDADRARGCPLHVLILGSAPLLMQSGLSESLTGRFEPIHVSHWSFGEMATAFGFDLPTYLYFGGYPGAAILARDEERWRNYVLGGIIEPTVERDLLALTRVDKPVLLKRLVELATAHSGQVLSYTKMLGQLWDAGNTTTLARYLDLLGSAGLVAGLQKYTGSAVTRRASSPKLNVLNTALMTRRLGLLLRRGAGGPDVLGPHRGERGGRPPAQHRNLRHPCALLARWSVRGRLRPATRTQAGRRRSEESANAAYGFSVAGSVRDEVLRDSDRALRDSRGRRHPTQRVPHCARGYLVPRTMGLISLATAARPPTRKPARRTATPWRSQTCPSRREPSPPATARSLTPRAKTLRARHRRRRRGSAP